MKAVLVVGNLPFETGHFRTLLKWADLAVYCSSAPRSDAVDPAIEASGSFRLRSFEPVRLGKQGHLRWLYRGLWSALDADQPDVVHVISEPWGLLAVQTALWARRRGFGGLVLHGCDQQWRAARSRRDFKKWPRVIMARFALRAAKGFAAENTAALETAHEGGLFSTAPTAVIHTNPRDPSQFLPALSNEERRLARKRLGLPVDGVGLGLIGRLVPEKGAGLFLEAWSILGRRTPSPDAWAAIAGQGPLERDLRRRADSRTRICGPLEFPDEVVRFLQGIDIFVHPPSTTSSWTEQAPRALIEAMLCGCLIVATDSGANAEVLDGTGILVPESDPEALAEGILNAIALVEGHEGQMMARQRAVKEFSVEATADKLLDLWRRVVASS